MLLLKEEKVSPMLLTCANRCAWLSFSSFSYSFSETLFFPSDKPYWTPLESNPDSLNEFAYKVGMPKSVAFTDCFGLDAELLAFLPRPVYAMILLFPYDNERIRAAKVAQDARLAEQAPLECFWMEQHIGNACGTIAVVHSVLNNRNNFELESGSLLDQYVKAAEPLSPADRGYLLGGWNDIQRVHAKAADVGQTAAPAADTKVNYHFVAFACVDNKVVEFDGGKRSQVVHRATTPDTFLEDCAATIQEEYFKHDPEGQFSIIVLSKSQ